MDSFSNITNCEIKQPGMLVARKIGLVSLAGCTYHWYNRWSGRKLILCIPPPIALVLLVVDFRPIRASEAPRFKIEVRLKWEMCQKELDKFGNIAVGQCSEDM